MVTRLTDRLGTRSPLTVVAVALLVACSGILVAGVLVPIGGTNVRTVDPGLPVAAAGAVIVALALAGFE